MSEIVEMGPWKAGTDKSSSGEYEVFVESEDFTHDVRLIVDGDFKDDEEWVAYAREIADRLNLMNPRKVQ